MIQADVVVIGAGIVGSCVGYHVARGGGPRVLVIDHDPENERASSRLGLGGVRQLFCSPENVALAQASLGFYRGLDARLERLGSATRIGFRPRGYLLLADRGNAARLEARLQRHRASGARVERLGRDAVRALVPDLVLDDIEFALFGAEDGYLDPRAALRAVQELARSEGVHFEVGDVAEILCEAGAARGVVLADGTTIRAGYVVNAAGAAASILARTAGLDLPIAPQRQQVLHLELLRRIPYRLPMVVDPSGVHVRPEDTRSDSSDCLLAMKTRASEPLGENFAVDPEVVAHDVWPPLHRRFAGLEGARVAFVTAGHYELTPDLNPLLGGHPALPGFLCAAGFSGHGVMLAPAAGRAIAELVRAGRSATFDLARFAPDRFARGARFDDDPMI